MKTLIYKHLQRIGFVFISLLITFLITMGPLQKVDAFNVLPWLDIPFHIWGGLLLGLLAVNLIFIIDILRGGKFLLKGKSDHAIKFMIFVISFVLFWGLVWEAWEFYMYISHHFIKWGGPLDTIKDLFDDIVGGILAYLYYIKVINKNSK